MVGAADLKNGVTFLFESKPYVVVRYEHQKIGRGSATIRVTMRNLESGDLGERTFSPNNKFDEIQTSKRTLQYLYNDGTTATFMDPRSYEQVEIDMELLGDSIKYVKEGNEVDILFWETQALSIDLPPKVTLEVLECDPGVKGNSASNMYKPATLENDLQVKVPLFIKPHDMVRVDTRTGDYVERVSK